MAKQKVRVPTPTGVLVYPRLNTPDTKFNKLGDYKADLRVPIEEAQPLIETINEAYKAHVGSPHPKFAPSKDRDAVYYFDRDEESGDVDKSSVVFKIRAKNKMTKQGELWDRRPKVFDAAGKAIRMTKPNGKLLQSAPKIGGGTKAIANIEIDPYETNAGAKGLRLVPRAVQIIDLVSFGDGGSAEDYGFGSQDGFTYDDEYDEGDDAEFTSDAASDDNDASTEDTEEGFY